MYRHGSQGRCHALVDIADASSRLLWLALARGNRDIRSGDATVEALSCIQMALAIDAADVAIRR